MPIERVGHVVLKMRDLEAAKSFYRDLLGMMVAFEQPGRGVFFRFNDYHHDLAVFQVSPDAELPKQDQVGLAHIALVADSLDTVRDLHRRLKAHGVEITNSIDHGATKSLYCKDPEGNAVEIYCEVPEFDWRRERLINRPLDLEAEVERLAPTV